ncbi:MAG: DUF3336 domain-containing protein [Alphaproteobacteria bacterium]|nr:DUF3336 domain-containing protein [Alphaproteobacteria bacterium]
MADRRRMTALRRALAEAEGYAEWAALAEEHDQLSGAERWRAVDASPHYHADLIRAQLDELRRLRALGDADALVRLLHTSINRNLGDLRAPQLYNVALLGTKHLIAAYLRETVATLDYLCEAELPDYPQPVKLAMFEAADRVYGRSALLLSGGATLGFTHIGVAKALFEAGLLPGVISGASTGAMVAGGLCTRTEPELAELFAAPEQMMLRGLAPAGPLRALDQRALLRPEALEAVLWNNIGDYSFGEAFQRTGRALNISVSPTRVRQRPRLLNHLTAPDVLVVSAAVASSALPTLFPPATLSARGPGGRVVPYIPSERWVDGSMRGDLPKARLGRLFNVNHTIVSQTNPHVAPFLREGRRTTLLRALVASTVAAQGAWAVDLARQLSGEGTTRAWLDHAHTLATQPYRGDIDLTPRFPPGLLARMVTNPTPESLRRFVAVGERTTWPRLAMIRDQTLVGRCFARCIRQLRASSSIPLPESP